MVPSRFSLAALTVAVVGLLALGAPRESRADDDVASARARANACAPLVAKAGVPAELMAGLAQHALRFEEMKRRGAFTMIGIMEELDRDGHASHAKKLELRSTPTSIPLDRVTRVIRYTDNGEDKTADAQKRATERRAKRLTDPERQAEERKRDLKLPFLATEQDRYVFSLLEHDPAQPSRTRIGFIPKTPAEDAIKGSAWVDEKEREVLSVGFSLSKNPMFVDHVAITIVFGLATELGRAPSTLSFDGRGGFLLIRKHYRGTVTLSQPAFAR